MRWTNKDEERLRQLFPVLSMAELEREFRPRSARSIYSRANKLKIRKANRIPRMEIARNYKPVIFRGQA